MAIILLFVGTVLVELPASLVMALSRPAGSPLVMDDVRGSLWRGRAMQVRWRDRELGSLSWTTRPRALLHGTLDVELHLRGEASAEARLIRGLGRTEIRQLDAVFPALWLQRGFAGGSLRTLGRVRVVLSTAVIERNRITALAGDAVWHDAVLRGPVVAALGTIRARFALADDQCVHGTIRDGGGPLSAVGGFVADLPHYSADVILAAREPQVASIIQWLGQPYSRGRRSLRFERGTPSGRCHPVRAVRSA